MMYDDPDVTVCPPGDTTCCTFSSIRQRTRSAGPYTSPLLPDPRYGSTVT
ncbi:hypothetical protein [Streptomyces werraensis]